MMLIFLVMVSPEPEFGAALNTAITCLLRGCLRAPVATHNSMRLAASWNSSTNHWGWKVPMLRFTRTRKEKRKCGEMHVLRTWLKLLGNEEARLEIK